MAAPRGRGLAAPGGRCGPGPGPGVKPRARVRIGTHGGTFHCDEALACFLLRVLPQYQDAEIVRTRDPQVLEECDVVVDVGGVYDPEKHRYDHHQRSFMETMASLKSGSRFVTKLSSAGLVYAHFGRRILTQLLQIDCTDPLLDILHDKEAFGKAVKLVGSEFLDRLQYYHTSWLPARSLIEEAIQDRFKEDDSGEIVVLGKGGCPWKEHVFELEKQLQIETPIKFVLYTDQQGQWRIQCVPQSPNSFQNRLSLPEEWRGLRDGELSAASGIPGCVFVHASGFIGGNVSRGGALEMAQAALCRGSAPRPPEPS
ncbi:UPF0160 protein MYG1, mitochondrial isoform X2 [Rhincodon typus]|uniref:UPF0160 protein MYG1, mitochondrial isoform X2 n=1 Tax=Rhincodon typus TaxID=259920 RepID=UPI00202FAD76|nr:UPF0160 protein MYG1, mitochondrial isoform X2 [Rhincodon typus]